jgi:5'-nucleotidase
MSRNDKPFKILLTNDDGIFAEGLLALHRTLARHHDVTVVAPDRERSAVGHGITLQHPLRALEVPVNGSAKGWAVSGTPADCVKLAILELLKERPDLVISGINSGANVGINLNYSGTVAAAKEAAMYGVQSMAVSIQANPMPSYDAAAAFVAHLSPKVVANPLPPGTFLNINFPSLPADQASGVCVSRQSADLYDEYFEKRLDPRERTYYWQGSVSEPRYSHQDADGAALLDNYISITPVQCDMTDYRALEQIRQWDFGNGYRRFKGDASRTDDDG